MPQKYTKPNQTQPAGQQAGLGYVPTRNKQQSGGGGGGSGGIIISGPPGNQEISLDPAVFAMMGMGMAFAEAGEEGQMGISIPGAPGPAGAAGATGATGPVGANGVPGVDGESSQADILFPPGSALPTTTTMGITINGAGAAIGTGVAGDLYIPVNCTIVANEMLGDVSGSVVVDVWRVAIGSYPPTVSNSIVASAPPTISSATNSQDTTLTGWSRSCTAGDTIRFNVDSCTSITRLSLSLKITIP